MRVLVGIVVGLYLLTGCVTTTTSGLPPSGASLAKPANRQGALCWAALSSGTRSRPSGMVTVIAELHILATIASLRSTSGIQPAGTSARSNSVAASSSQIAWVGRVRSIVRCV